MVTTKDMCHSSKGHFTHVTKCHEEKQSRISSGHGWRFKDHEKSTSLLKNLGHETYNRAEVDQILF